jgi:feruloyl esterase
MEALHYPWDFNGIVVLSPGPDLMKVHMTMLWDRLVTTGSNGKSLISEADLQLVHKAVLTACDGKDGLKDGIIADPRLCHFNPAVLECARGQKADCLSAAQVEAVDKVYSGPVTSKGKTLFFGSMPGSELGSAFLGSRYSTEFFRYLAFLPDAGPAWESRDFDFDSDYERFGTLDSFYNPTNPDLREFKAAGGKLIIVQPWQDSGVPIPLDTIDYYETVERTMGGQRATQEFARLFMVPGMDHCMGGPGTNGANYLGYLREWVERGRPPGIIISYHSDSKDPADYVGDWKTRKRKTMTRPLYPYPLQARYKGSGDPNDYKSFVPGEIEEL